MTAGAATARSPGLAALRRPAAVALAAAGAFALVALVDPNEPGHYPVCPFFAVTGHFCPGCGSLRAMHALSRGDLGGAAGLNLLTVASLPLLGALWLRWTARSWRGAAPGPPAHPVLLWAFLGVVLGFWLVRNLPFGAILAP